MLKVGFFKFTVQEQNYSISLTLIIQEALEIWTNIVKKPDISKFETEDIYNNYDLTIDFKVAVLDPPIQEQVKSEIITRNGNNFGTSFPKTTEITLDETYMGFQVNSLTGEIDNERQRDAVRVRVLRAIGNVLGIGHLWKQPGAPIVTDTLGKSYYTGTNGLQKYRNTFVYFTPLFGIPLEDYDDNLIYLEEGVEGAFSKNVTLDGITHPGLDNELMTYWVDSLTETDVHPISQISAGLLEDIGYDVCYNFVEEYTPPSTININYKIFVDFKETENIFNKLNDKYILEKNKYTILIPDDKSNSSSNVIKSVTDFVETMFEITANNEAHLYWELTLIYNSVVNLVVELPTLTINGETLNIYNNVNNVSQVSNPSAKQKYVILFVKTEISSSNYKILLDKVTF